MVADHGPGSTAGDINITYLRGPAAAPAAPQPPHSPPTTGVAPTTPNVAPLPGVAAPTVASSSADGQWMNVGVNPRQRPPCSCGAPRERDNPYCGRCGGLQPASPPPNEQRPTNSWGIDPAPTPQVLFPQGMQTPPAAAQPVPGTPTGARARAPAGAAAPTGSVGSTADSEAPQRRRKHEEVSAGRTEYPVTALQQALQAMNRQVSSQLSSLNCELQGVKSAVTATQGFQRKQQVLQDQVEEEYQGHLWVRRRDHQRVH